MAKPYINHILFDIEAVLDTDMGIAMFMDEFGNNPNIVNSKMFGLTSYDYHTLLLNRKYENPLRMFIRQEFWSDVEDLRTQMYESEDAYGKILNRSTTTGIFAMVRELRGIGRSGHTVTILCHKQQEAEYIRDLLKKEEIEGVQIVTADDRYFTGFDVADYDTIFVKNIKTPMSFQNFMGKNLYVCRYRFNLDEENYSIPDKAIYADYHLTRAIELYLIDVYGRVDINFFENNKEEIPDE